MQPIERYGVISLLALVVIITAVILWDQAEDEQPVLAANPNEQAQPVKPVQPMGLNRGANQPATNVPIQKPAWNKEQAANTRKQWDAETDQLAAQLERAKRDLEASAPKRAPEPKETRSDWSPNADADKLLGETLTALASEPKNLGSATVQPKAPAPKAAATRTYEIKSGDTFSEIAQRELGSTKFTNALVEANPKVDPTRMIVGTKLVLPSVEGAKAGSASTPTAARTSTKSTPAAGQYRVLEGESLWTIAERTLGSGERYKDILAANPGLSADRLKAGQLIQLPSGADLDAKRVSSAGNDRVASQKTESKPAARKGVVL